ncbi:RNA polymerase-associated protein RapA [Xenorhabdus nematophila]|uniref:RNA polymerase-associated protein RapA n=1 Tax=Xenorhabdus nematophila (strain ATCC 19061 / DSM 3370 / CCUG 14189 / LMG 1036 / NCIMB 9965 / AN6) TaxID=406817 RepID=D3VCP9_XENNA|nr:RNA polymerase-associated protein RapA [Xenorhabdus nematophila]CEF33059.1 ATPase associated with RNA polymerase and transcriptional activator [Xenorhabdus nematophila str. Websteri]AYA42110.1 RNA polymerase-associated protein RapA [Xenorhabdus nematophila]MBA0020832.1 RNA polymerase-associated protein RapA [Xenorhabdus nematophila]MCB4424080.1 RNA polymerase-associated protein RapA [Xenorhabdus nematophila]QNJ36483.1 RNA polymerase-associated protein RapA [Xenorhabdus nematophila]
MPFTLGQRWISDTESELGLGTIVALDARMVTLLFPASGENRLYARNDSPITRVMFNVGDTVTSHEGWKLKIDDVQQDNGLLIYVGTRLDTEEENTCLREVFLDSKLTFNKPQDRLFAGQIDRMDRFALRLRARKHQSEQFRLAESGLRGIRASLIPHQLHIANEVGKRHAPRVLLADEVGLGKTIEAGMIIHQQLMAGRAERVLVIVPDSLQHQWLVEMLRRFNLRFSLFDDGRYTEALHDSDNPFETEQLVICSLDFVRRNKQRFEHLLEASWDLMVVDEAHHLEWSEKAPSREYHVIEQLSEQIPAVLLLTATPEQLGQESHFARLRLLDPNRFHDYQAFIDEQQKYRPVADAVTLLLSGEILSNDQQNAIVELISEQDIEPLLKAVNSQQDEESNNARRELVAMLMDRHGTSRLLFRNTRGGVKGFPHRELHEIKLPLPAQYQTAIKVSEIMGAKKTVEARAKDMLYPERIYQEFEGENATWWNFDPRVEWLMGFLMANRDEKVLVICAKAETALQLEQVLREREGIRSAVFHEGLSLLERDRAAAYFASEEEGAQVLLCSEIGSEGRNFQFANQLVMFDLPFNPDLLEQRIGRLDRIGQTRDIKISVPYLENTAQSILLRWYHEGLDAFEHTCPTGRPIYDKYYEVLLNFLAKPNEQTGFNEFIAECRTHHEQLRQQLEQGRDRLLEMNSNGGEQGQQLAEKIAAQDNDTDLVNFALNLFDIVGINQEDHSDSIIALHPSDHMLVPDFPGLPKDGCSITFDREKALSREDTQFLSWEHPIIRNGLDLILSGDTGSCAVSILKNKALPVGTLLVELVYVVEAQAPKHLQLTRFLPPTPVRLLLDLKGTDLAPQVEFESFNRQLNAINRHNASKLVNAVQKEVHAILQQSEPLIEKQSRELIEKAKKEADEALSAELSRLEALKAVNPNIRDDELDAIESEHKHVLLNLDQATWRLDAIRLVVVSHQ